MWHVGISCEWSWLIEMSFDCSVSTSEDTPSVETAVLLVQLADELEAASRTTEAAAARAGAFAILNLLASGESPPVVS
jgi:hypothetical protein